MEPRRPLYVPPGEQISYLFTASLPTCQFAWELGISKNLDLLYSTYNLFSFSLWTLIVQIIHIGHQFCWQLIV